MATATADWITNAPRYASSLTSIWAAHPEGLGTSLGETMESTRGNERSVELQDQISRIPDYVLLGKLLEEDLQFRDFIDDLLSLFSENEEDEPAVAENALVQALDLTPLARSLLAQRWPSPRVATDGAGGIRLNWKTGARELRAVIPGKTNRERYLYWEDGDRYGAVQNFTAASLYRWMDWLKAEDAGPERN